MKLLYGIKAKKITLLAKLSYIKQDLRVQEVGPNTATMLNQTLHPSNKVNFVLRKVKLYKFNLDQ